MLRVGTVLLFLLVQPFPIRAWFSFKISNAEQCAPITLTFWNRTGSGNPPPFSDKAPSSLVILPFGSSPFTIPISDVTHNSTAVTVTFLPLAEGTSFLASLEDQDGRATGFVSDVIPVLPSQSNNRTCLPPSGNQTRVYNLDPSQITQCAPFRIQYDPAVVSPPIVKAYFPRGFSYRLNATNTQLPGQAEYQAKLFRGFQTVLSIRDPNGPTFETTNLTTVGGDALSPRTCLNFGGNISKIGGMMTSGAQKLSQSAVAGIGAAVGIVAACIVLLVAFLIMRSLKRRNRFGVKLPDSPNPPPPPEKPNRSINSSEPQSVLLNPPYVAANYSGPPSPVDRIRSPSISSFIDDMFSTSPRTPPVPLPEIRRSPSRSPLTIPPSVHRRPGSIDVPVTPSVAGLWIGGSQPVSMISHTPWNNQNVPEGTTNPPLPVSIRNSTGDGSENPFHGSARVKYRETGESSRMFRPHHQPHPSVQSSAGSVYFVPGSGGLSLPLQGSQRNDNRF